MGKKEEQSPAESGSSNSFDTGAHLNVLSLFKKIRALASRVLEQWKLVSRGEQDLISAVLYTNCAVGLVRSEEIQALICLPGNIDEDRSYWDLAIIFRDGQFHDSDELNDLSWFSLATINNNTHIHTTSIN